MLKRISMWKGNWVSPSKKQISRASRDNTKLTMCKRCYAFYYQQSWHFERPEYVVLDCDENISVRFTECSACVEQEVALYETEAELVLENG